MSESSAELATGRSVSERLNELEDTVGRLERGAMSFCERDPTHLKPSWEPARTKELACSQQE